VHEAESWLIWREGRSIYVRSSGSVDDVCGIFVEGVAWGIESMREVICFVGISGAKRWPFEALWEVGDLSIVVEVSEEKLSY